VPGIYKEKEADVLKFVSTDDSYRVMKELLDAEGIFIGHSGGAAIYAALELAKELEEGVVVTILPDAGFRYLSDRLWW
ncbi:MAG: pyridoxal-phosphate dependent enzyme, partial [Thermodesulfobacteriota bacterium]